MTPDQATDVFAQHGIISTAEAEQQRRDAEQQRRDAELRAHNVLTQIMQRVPANIRIDNWAVSYATITILLSGVAHDHDARAKVMLLAEQFGLNYVEAKFDSVWNKVAATGYYEGTPVEFWRFVQPCACGNCGAPQ